MLRKSIITPKNYGRGNRVASVEQELNWTIARANAQYQEAFKPDGVPVIFWKKTDEGNFCTCRYGKALLDKVGSDNLKIPTGSDIPNASDDDNGGGRFVAEELPNDNFSLERGDKSIYNVRNQWDDNRALQVRGADRYYSGDRLDINDENEGSGSSFSPPSSSGGGEEEQSEDEEAFLSAPVDSDSIFGLEKSQCGICLGTGRTQAWNLFNGKREIFDSYNVGVLKGFSIDGEAKPLAFKTSLLLDNYVEWEYNLPTYFNKVLNFAVRNNTKSSRYLKLFYKIDGTNDDFQRLTEQFIESRRGIPTKLILRVQSIRNAMDETASFTHFEISFEFSKLPTIEMTPLSISSNDQIQAVATSAQFTFPPTFNNIDRSDIFLDTKYGYIWKVSDFTDFQTAKRQVLGWTVSARNLQAWEQQSLLKVSFDKYYETSFAGLEQFQGSLLSGSDLL